jgi:Ca2+-binding RTX toxin-like protein
MLRTRARIAVTVTAFLVAATAAGAAARDEPAGPVFATSVNFGYVAFTALGPNGSVAVAGYVEAEDDFHPTPGAYDQTPGGDPLFVAKVDATGRVVWASYLGGDGTEGTVLGGLVVGSDGSVSVTGGTTAPDFPTTPGAYATTVDWNHAPTVGFATRFSADGSSLDYSTLLPRTYGARAPQLDPDGRLVVAGDAYPSFVGTRRPIGPIKIDPDANPVNQYVLELTPGGSDRRFAALVGGSHDGDAIFGIAVGPDGDVYLTGRTESADFPVTAGALGDGRQSVIPSEDVFAMRIDPADQSLVWSARFGGLQQGVTEFEEGHVAAVRPDGRLVVEGMTDEADFPLTPDAPYTQPDADSVSTGFVAQISADGSTLSHSTLVPQTHEMVQGIDRSLTLVHQPSDTTAELWTYDPRDGQVRPTEVSYPSSRSAPTLLAGVDGAGTVYLVTPRPYVPGKAAGTKTRLSRRVTACTIAGTSGDDRLNGTPRPDVICAGGGNDVIGSLGRADIVYAGPGADVVRGGTGVDVVYGGPGRDVLRGQDQRDLLIGGRGNDLVDGARGEDTLVGGSGADDLHGGSGHDDCHQATEGLGGRSC